MCKNTLMKINYVKAYLFLVLTSLTAFTFPDDIKQDASSHCELKSDMSVIDSRSGMTWFLQSASLNTSTMKINANSIGVDQKNGVIQKIISIGNPARFLYKQYVVDDWLYGSGNTIEYIKSSEEVKIIGSPSINYKKNSYNGTVNGCIRFDLIRKITIEYGRKAYVHPPNLNLR